MTRFEDLNVQGATAVRKEAYSSAIRVIRRRSWMEIMPTDIDRGLAKSMELLDRASTERGFVASPSEPHYGQIWTRDAAITSLGALASGKPDLIETAVRTLRTVGATATQTGQIAAVVHSGPDSWDWGEGGVVDATAWYVILSGAVLAVTGDENLAREHWPTVLDAMSWLRHQDVTGSGLISAAPSTDWMDSSLVRSGRTLNLNALYHWAALSTSRLAGAIGRVPPVDPDDLAWRINALFWPSEAVGPEMLLTGLKRIPERFPHEAMIKAHEAAAIGRRRTHYVSHVIHSHYDEHCDVLANLILICTRLADQSTSRTILDHLAASGVEIPFPSRTLTTPVDTSRPTSMFVAGVEKHLNPRWKNAPGHYHNGGIWPFVGGFHTTALALIGEGEKASALLKRLAAANEIGNWGFHEWLQGVSGEPRGARDQSWNAGTYLLAAEATQDPERIRRLFV